MLFLCSDPCCECRCAEFVDTAGEIIQDILNDLGSWDILANSYRISRDANITDSYCSFPFIKCDKSQRITSIVLERDPHQPALPGNLSTKLEGLTALQEIVIFNHSIRGSLPRAWGSPGQFSALQTM